MPPKPQKPQTSKKTEMKKKEKVIEDRTFGLKNKKGAKMQKYVQQVEKQVKTGPNVKASKVVDPKLVGAKKEEDDPTKDLFKPVIVQKALDKNVDPKSVLCAFFKSGQCAKGNKCKFSHDPEVERRAEKRNLYVDERKEDETMDDWDEAKLEEVINKKHGVSKPVTDIICKFFLDAVENNKYGWFWECPNGNEKCHYRHALPPGFVLKKDKKKLKELEKENAITLEELIEEERKKLDSGNCTKVTLESFLAWKRKKRKERKEQAERDLKKKEKDFRRGLSVGLSGREMFLFDPSLVSAEDGVGDDEASFDISALKREAGEEGGDDEENDSRFEFKEIDLAALTLMEDEEEDDEKAVRSLDEPEGAVGGPIDESLFDEEALGLDDDDEELNGVD